MVERKFDLTKDAVTAKTVAPNAVGTEELKNGAVTTSKLADEPNGVDTDKINFNVVTGSKMAYETIEEENIMNDAVTAPKLQCIKYGTISITPGTIGGNSTTNVEVAVSGIGTTDKIVASCQEDLEHGLVPIAAYCGADGTLTVRLTNWTTGGVSGAAKEWLWVAYKTEVY